MEKMGTVEQVATRKNLYELISATLEQNGMSTETIKGGRLIDLGNGYYGKFSVSICDPEKVDKYRDEYNEQVEKNAQRAAERAAKKEAKENKNTPVEE